MSKVFNSVDWCACDRYFCLKCEGGDRCLECESVACADCCEETLEYHSEKCSKYKPD